MKIINNIFSVWYFIILSQQVNVQINDPKNGH